MMRNRKATKTKSLNAETANYLVTASGTGGFLKCVNCGEEHSSTDSDCPKRKQFIEMRSKMSSSNNNNKTKKESDNPLKLNLENFPEMENRRSRRSDSIISISLNSPVILTDLQPNGTTQTTGSSANPWTFSKRMTL